MEIKTKQVVNWTDIKKEREEYIKDLPNAVPVGKSKLIYQRITDHAYVFRLVK